ncbi:glycosyltransferase family 2 protein [Undibacterium sp. TJN19]|uniref:glycosyltransferase family 2 protein n=1 Tax=Undibacterium sp. TJN19 TaxID=3413055 RepID=UPI003BF3A663
MSQSRISIALCTYNGEEFLLEQLQSFLLQSLQPFELVVCDDLSTDSTCDIIRQFGATAGFPVSLHVNQQRLGSSLNFGKVISLCKGDVIALSDQDDIWHVDKLEKIANMFVDESVTAVFSDAEVTDASLQALGYTMWQGLKFDIRTRRHMQMGDSFDILLKRFLVMGASMAFRTSLREIVLPIPATWHHDAWIALLAAACGNIVPVDECLVKYRQHGNNQIGGRKVSVLSQIRNALQINRTAYLRDELALWINLQQRLNNQLISPKHRSACAEKCAHLQRRMDFPKSRWQRLARIVADVYSGSYARYTRNWGSIALDILIK